MRAPSQSRFQRQPAGFTVLEVVLAVVIAVGLLLVLLQFYSRTADLREQLLRETERISAARLILDRLTAELRAVPGRCFYKPVLSGTSSSLQFIKTELPPRTGWSGAQMGRAGFAQTDLRLVKYSASGGTNVTGLVRTEEPVAQTRPQARAQSTVELDPKPPLPPLPLTDEFRFVAFRYWDGLEWRDSWNAPALPQGVEISLAVEPPVLDPELAEVEEYPEEVFRRVIFLPASGSADDILFAELFTETPESTASDASSNEPPPEEMLP